MKRFCDLFLILATAWFWLPLLAVVALIVKRNYGSPVWFRQKRPGFKGEPFELLKFRTMTNERAAQGQLLPDSDRLTPLGRFLRSSSLDELPELINVLEGKMSLVGPRPLLMQYLDRYTSEQARRHDVRPGITGWAQINGRNGIAWEDKFRLDVWYVDHQSIWLDFKILVITIWTVLVRKGINARGHATMPVFKGTSGRD